MKCQFLVDGTRINGRFVQNLLFYLFPRTFSKVLALLPNKLDGHLCCCFCFCGFFVQRLITLNQQLTKRLTSKCMWGPAVHIAEGKFALFLNYPGTNTFTLLVCTYYERNQQILSRYTQGKTLN